MLLSQTDQTPRVKALNSGSCVYPNDSACPTLHGTACTALTNHQHWAMRGLTFSCIGTAPL